jgi:hypothetical protein
MESNLFPWILLLAETLLFIMKVMDEGEPPNTGRVSVESSLSVRIGNAIRYRRSRVS